MTEHEREAKGFYNGAVWQSPSLLIAVLTWLDRDRWALMSAPEKSRCGGYCMIPHCNVEGIWMWDGDYLPERLAGWTWLPDKTLLPLGSKSGA